ncbi:putative Integral membrane protein [Seiridium unicorne]|uniref:Integral membrane protein n=1 Tax=Seiridium unicorne TaxID=138068 RepID=A0ABR2V943_9PEZI
MTDYYTTPASIIFISIFFPILGATCVALRFYTRAKAKSAFWWDDWLCIPALTFELAMAGLLIWGASKRALGVHLPVSTDPSPNAYLFFTSPQQIILQQIQYFFDLIGVFAFGSLKLSILFFYRKIFCVSKTNKDAFNTITTSMIAIVIAWTLSFGIGAIFLCGARPAYAWAPVALVAEHCTAQLQFLEAYAISDFITDCFIWSLPIPKIWGLHMAVRKRLSVIAIFLVGVLLELEVMTNIEDSTIGASGARMAIYIIFVVNAFAQSDGEKIITYLLFWTMIECGLGLMVVCLPALRAPMRTFFTAISPGSLISGIKSVFTTRSLKTEGSLEAGVYRLDSVNQSHRALTSDWSRYAPMEGPLHTSVVGPTDSDHSVRQVKPMNGAIHVQSEMQQY